MRKRVVGVCLGVAVLALLAGARAPVLAQAVTQDIPCSSVSKVKGDVGFGARPEILLFANACPREIRYFFFDRTSGYTDQPLSKDVKAGEKVTSQPPRFVKDGERACPEFTEACARPMGQIIYVGGCFLDDGACMREKSKARRGLHQSAGVGRVAQPAPMKQATHATTRAIGPAGAGLAPRSTPAPSPPPLFQPPVQSAAAPAPAAPAAPTPASAPKGPDFSKCQKFYESWICPSKVDAPGWVETEKREELYSNGLPPRQMERGYHCSARDHFELVENWSETEFTPAAAQLLDRSVRYFRCIYPTYFYDPPKAPGAQ